MNREIKFRIYDKTSDNIFYSNDHHMELDLTNKVVYINETNIDYENEIEAVLMQYTGLKDKNGKEIYEGDIVDFRHGERKLYIAFNLGQWSMCGCLNEPNKDYRNLNHYVNHDGPIEVIGNIYENPELLKEVQNG